MRSTPLCRTSENVPETVPVVDHIQGSVTKVYSAGKVSLYMFLTVRHKKEHFGFNELRFFVQHVCNAETVLLQHGDRHKRTVPVLQMRVRFNEKEMALRIPLS